MRVPSSVAIYAAATELTNYRKHVAQTPSQNAPHKSLLPRLVRKGVKIKSTKNKLMFNLFSTLGFIRFEFSLSTCMKLPKQFLNGTGNARGCLSEF